MLSRRKLFSTTKYLRCGFIADACGMRLTKAISPASNTFDNMLRRTNILEMSNLPKQNTSARPRRNNSLVSGRKDCKHFNSFFLLFQREYVNTPRAVQLYGTTGPLSQFSPSEPLVLETKSASQKYVTCICQGQLLIIYVVSHHVKQFRWYTSSHT